MLWIALHLPWLSLETVAVRLGRPLPLPLAPSADVPVAPLALEDGHQVVLADPAAQALGVQPGMRRATALALAPALTLAQAEPGLDAQALQAVAHAALACTPHVSLAPPQTVLLEVQSMLRYFGGLAALLRRLMATLEPLGHRVQAATAPTAQGAALLARWARRGEAVVRPGDPPHPAGDLHCADLQALRRRLDGAPVWLLGPGREHWEALQGMGLRTLGDLRSLPRAGLARRFGEALLHELDCALGRRPDPRRWVELPPTFAAQLELLARADTTDQVLHGARLLLARLVLWAQARQVRIRRFVLVMVHERRHRSDLSLPPTELEVALADPSCDAEHLQVLLREQLARVQLAAPTLELRLRCDDVAHQPAPNGELFPTPQNERAGLTRLIERLQARLGREQVRSLAFVADHRPECSSASRPLDLAGGLPRTTQPDAAELKRLLQQPVWLLAPPEPLDEHDGQPWLDGRPLHLLCGPERLESGWWDGALAERDYFVAQAADAALVWIYRHRLPGSARGAAWHLHGRFG
jgi:protein ImuB